jgi:hypothetical protein
MAIDCYSSVYVDDARNCIRKKNLIGVKCSLHGAGNRCKGVDPRPFKVAH